MLESDALERIGRAIRATEILVEAHDRGAENGGSVEWEDLDLAYEHAREALGKAPPPDLESLPDETIEQSR